MRALFLCLTIIIKILSIFDINWFSLNFILNNFFELINLDIFNLIENSDNDIENNNKSFIYSETFWFLAAGITIILIVIIISNGGDGGGIDGIPPTSILTVEEKLRIMRETLEACKKKT